MPADNSTPEFPGASEDLMYRRIHTIPVGDIELHAAQEVCWCYPMNTARNVWVHNAKDCREARERMTGEGCSAGWICIAEYLMRPPITPDTQLPPLGEGPRRKMIIEIEVSADFEKRLDNQWMVEREIHADRWSWRWATPTVHPSDRGRETA